MTRERWRRCVCSLLLLFAVVSSCKTWRRPPDVIVYLVDTLRPDHLGIYGYARSTSPCLDRFAEDGVVFDDAYTPAAWTKPATASMLTGLLPRRHGAITHTDRLPSRVQTAGELLKERGYHTAAFVTNPNVIALWGFDQGMDVFRDLRVRARPARANQVVRTVLDWLARTGTERPVFLYVHTIEPHAPNNPPEPFRSMWPRRTRKKASHTKRIRPTTPPDLLHDIIANYDGDVAFSDSQFGELIRGLKRLGRYDRSLILYLSDHGEELQDHGYGGHGHTLYQELVRVPLLIKYPGRRNAGKRIAARVSLLDVLPTILRAAGARVPAGLDGTDLTPVVEGGQEMPPRDLLLDLEVQSRSSGLNVLRGLVGDRMKYIERSKPQPKTEAFDLVADPHERNNLVDKDPEVAAALARRLHAMVAETQGGIHLRLVNEGDDVERSFAGRLRTTGRFVDPLSWQFEAEDRLTVSGDGRSIEFEVRSVNRKNLPRHIPRQIVDEDDITFRVQPPDAEVVLETLEASGFAETRVFVGSQRLALGAPPIAFQPDDPRFAAESVSAPFPKSQAKSIEAPGGAYLAVVPYGVREATVPDDETLERLRALGYVQ